MMLKNIKSSLPPQKNVAILRILKVELGDLVQWRWDFESRFKTGIVTGCSSKIVPNGMLEVNGHCICERQHTRLIRKGVVPKEIIRILRK